MDTCEKTFSSTNSGSKCRNAPPNNPPTDNATKRLRDLFNFSLFIDKVNKPTNETSEIIKIDKNNSINT